ncbi:MAG: histidine--tRNA ligase [Saprospiraceae bacterium]|nr:histidine--tRNA ligase [Saprospiraceae bacterium]
MKPSLPKGTRDYSPKEVYRQNYIFATIRQVFEKFGYQPIETPAMENLETLLGKYGDEGDKLLFKVLNNGDYLAKADLEALQEKDSNRLVKSISKRGLRYDLTVPFARYVVMHQHELSFPFKRYQIQPVWRADRPQKGRYQEFYQCDADVIGSDSLIYEAEYVLMIDEVFTKLGIDVEIKLNHRQVLAGIAETAGIADKMVPMTVAIDKLDKIGWTGVASELRKADIEAASIDRLQSLYSGQHGLDHISEALDQSDDGRKGVEELKRVFDYLESANLKQELKFDPTLARGLSYYTGCIFEVKSKEVSIGSILGGGRYANLTGAFGMPDMSGVGISFGVARIFDVLQELDRFPGSVDHPIKVLLIALDEDCHRYAFDLLHDLRSQEIPAHLYPEPGKLKKQMKYADATEVPFVILIGSDEMKRKSYTVKHMKSGEQWDLSFEAIIEKLGELR